MPMQHRSQTDQTVEYFLAEGEKIGPCARYFVEGVFSTRKHPALGYRTCQGLLRLAKKCGAIRVEAACQKAVDVKAFAYRSLESLLAHNLDQLNRAPIKEHTILHHNIRGADYYRNNTQEETKNADTPNTGETENTQAEWHA